MRGSEPQMLLGFSVYGQLYCHPIAHFLTSAALRVVAVVLAPLQRCAIVPSLSSLVSLVTINHARRPRKGA